MIIRSLDSDHDFEFGKGIQSFQFGQQAIIENIQTRLMCFLNDCFFDRNFGIDWLRLLGTPGTQQELSLSCRAIILQSFGVTRMNTFSVSVVNRRAILQFNINSIFTQNALATLEVP